eukprot:2639879-Alexandrium_andersonii.AAC.1
MPEDRVLALRFLGRGILANLSRDPAYWMSGAFHSPRSLSTWPGPSGPRSRLEVIAARRNTAMAW